jgi:hypothetical protein
MKKLVLIATLVGLLALSAGLVNAQPSSSSSAPAPTAPAQGGKKEAHPAIRAALRSLERAKVELQNAAHDFGGHRKDALAACDQAIAQLKLALQYDKN